MKTTTQTEAQALLLAWSEAKFAGFTGLADALADELHRLHWGCPVLHPKLKPTGEIPIYFDEPFTRDTLRKIMHAMGIHGCEVDWLAVDDVIKYAGEPVAL